MLLRLIKEVGTLLPKLIGVDKMIIGPLLTGSGARVVWLLLRVAKAKRYRCLTRANLL